jgi:MOSC domain-containing protein YiiM
MKLVSINIGRKATLDSPLYTKPTGILKRPVARANIHALGVDGDHVDDQKYHGGPDQAVYVYTDDDYDFWRAELQTVIEPGTFGENITVSGVESASLNVGDRLHIGAVTLEVAAPRIPCSTLAARMEDPQFVKRFKAAGRPGAYCRVITPGEVVQGDPVTLERVRDSVTLGQLFGAWFDQLEEREIQRLLAAPLAVRYRAELERRLER